MANMFSLKEYSVFDHFIISSPAEYVALVEINRPHKLNAFIDEMWIELGQVFEKLSYDQEVRTIILSGAGDRAFTAGLDVQAASQNAVLGGGDPSMDGARRATVNRRHLTAFQNCISQIEKCEKRKWGRIIG